jgi:hypothetical protein
MTENELADALADGTFIELADTHLPGTARLTLGGQHIKYISRELATVLVANGQADAPSSIGAALARLWDGSQRRTDDHRTSDQDLELGRDSINQPQCVRFWRVGSKLEWLVGFHEEVPWPRRKPI